MNKIIYPAVAAVLGMSLSSCGVKIINEKDNISKAMVVTEKFDAIESYGTTDIEYTPGPAKFTLSAPEEYIDKIKIYVEDGKLIVTREDSDHIEGNDHSKLIVSYPEVKSFSTFGTGDFKLSGISVNDLNMITLGTGDFDCKDIKCGTLNAKTSGTGDIEIEGVECIVAFLTSEGTGDVEIERLTADTVDASTQGTGDITLEGECRSAQYNSSGIGDINNKKLRVIK